MHKAVEFILAKADALDEEADLAKKANKFETRSGKFVYADTVDSSILRTIASKLRIMAGKLEQDIKELENEPQ